MKKVVLTIVFSLVVVSKQYW